MSAWSRTKSKPVLFHTTMQGPSSQGHHSGTHLRPVFSRNTSQAKSAACSTRAGSRHTRIIAQQGLGIRRDTSPMSFHIIGLDITDAAFRNRLVPHQGTSTSSHLVQRLDPTRSNSIQLDSSTSCQPHIGSLHSSHIASSTLIAAAPWR